MCSFSSCDGACAAVFFFLGCFVVPLSSPIHSVITVLRFLDFVDDDEPREAASSVPDAGMKYVFLSEYSLPSRRSYVCE